MPPTIPHVLLTVHGSLPAGESWSCGLRSLATATALGGAPGAALAIAAGNRWRGLANSANASYLFGNTTGGLTFATIDGVTVRRLDEDGQTVEQYEGSPTTALVPNGPTRESYPNQCALVATLVTARAGRTGKGRIYLPCVTSLNVANGRIPGATTTSIATAVKAMIDGLNTDLRTATDPAQKLAVQSSVASQEPGAWTVGAPGGYMGAAIVSVRIGDTIDTQRRRRSSITENYATAQIT